MISPPIIPQEETLPLTLEGTQSTIDDLFEMDPLSLSDQDIARLVTHFRQERALFATETLAAKNEGRAKKPTRNIKAPLAVLSLDDLDIDL